ncbi:UNVERIFIED_ORG: hypothetical protein J2S99_001452 [Atlantibacter hermannii]|nr:hypothetical protein [Atlantibacter hermannii]
MKSLLIDNINFSSKIWVVRPGIRYLYTGKFIDNSYIAIGHLDEYGVVEDLLLSGIDYENIDKVIPEYNKIDSRNVKTQIETFLIEMKVGDVVFTLDSKHVIPGVIKTKPFLSNEPISDLDHFILRRTVEWGEPILRKNIPVTIQRSFTGYQTVFSLSEHSEELFHWLMSFFISGDNYFGSLRIEQHHALKHHTLKQLSELIDRIQVISILIAEKYEADPSIEKINTKITFEELQRAMERYSDEGRLDLTVKQITMSPGDLWLQFKSPSRIAGTVFLYLLLTTMGRTEEFKFTDATYANELQKVHHIVENNREILTEDIDLSKVKRQLILRVSEQNVEFVESSPTSNNGDGFPNDGAPKNIGK